MHRWMSEKGYSVRLAKQQIRLLQAEARKECCLLYTSMSCSISLPVIRRENTMPPSPASSPGPGSRQRYNILLEKAKKVIVVSNHFDSDISVRIEVKANHRTSRSGRYGCPASRQPRSFPSDHR